MDTVIFTGRLSLEELQHERPLEYERLVAEKKLDENMTGPQAAWLSNIGVLFGFAVILIGFILLALIILGQFFY
jgi:hypothetical protein